MRFALPLLSLLFAGASAQLTPSVSSATTVVGSGTYPRLTTLADNSILAGYSTGGYPNARNLYVVRSTDGGNTFSAWGTVEAGSTSDVDNINLMQLPSGYILAAFRNNDYGSSQSSYTYYRITIVRSTDNGVTWSYLSQAYQRTATTTLNGLWEPFLRLSKSGNVQVYFAAENSSTDQDILMCTSTDGGATWGAPTTVAGASTTGRDGMPGCADYTVGSATHTMCVFETTEGTAPYFNVKSVISTDDGATWGSRSLVFQAGSGKNAGAPQLIKVSTGVLVTSFMTNEDTSGYAWPAGASMKIVTANGGDAPVWGHKTTVFPVSSYWPGMMATGTNLMLGCADYGGSKCKFIGFGA